MAKRRTSPIGLGAVAKSAELKMLAIKGSTRSAERPKRKGSPVTRQQRRAELRSVAKDIKKANSGQLTAGQVKAVRSRIIKLQKAGVIPTPEKKPIVQRIGAFVKSLGRPA